MCGIVNKEELYHYLDNDIEWESNRDRLYVLEAVSEFDEVGVKEGIYSHYDSVRPVCNVGRWIQLDPEALALCDDGSVIYDYGYECSECSMTSDVKTRYCPYCGARMDNSKYDIINRDDDNYTELKSKIKYCPYCGGDIDNGTISYNTPYFTNIVFSNGKVIDYYSERLSYSNIDTINKMRWKDYIKFDIEDRHKLKVYHVIDSDRYYLKMSKYVDDDVSIFNYETWHYGVAFLFDDKNENYLVYMYGIGKYGDSYDKLSEKVGIENINYYIIKDSYEWILNDILRDVVFYDSDNESAGYEEVLQLYRDKLKCKDD